MSVSFHQKFEKRLSAWTEAGLRASPELSRAQKTGLQLLGPGD
ncbi:hypothetical protein [Rhodoferax koreensis]|nr:hypothetical protein [Rhodoferax koreense]